MEAQTILPPPFRAKVAKAIQGNANVIENLTTFTFELGGKGAAVVTRSILYTRQGRQHPGLFNTLTQRLVHGKFENNGQVCVAPDYVLVHADVLGQ